VLPGVLPDTEELRGLSRKPTEWATSETSGNTDSLGPSRTQPENSDQSRKPAPVRVCGFESHRLRYQQWSQAQVGSSRAVSVVCRSAG